MNNKLKVIFSFILAVSLTIPLFYIMSDKEKYIDYVEIDEDCEKDRFDNVIGDCSYKYYAIAKDGSACNILLSEYQTIAGKKGEIPLVCNWTPQILYENPELTIIAVLLTLLYIVLVVAIWIYLLNCVERLMAHE